MTSREIVADAALAGIPAALATVAVVLPGAARSAASTFAWVWPRGAGLRAAAAERRVGEGVRGRLGRGAGGTVARFCRDAAVDARESLPGAARAPPRVSAAAARCKRSNSATSGRSC